ncbi:C69 family dipeptidase [Dichelobacter nodosus]|uniref:Dipeptidase n=2 Tax=Dichelobacter nodosus TaxID=870 RepID=A5EY41_DICNV|nr:hypothetical protein DNO_0944 [Dichelobacter nodosus VCS1703A]
MEDRNRSRTYSGIKLLNPNANIKYTDTHYELLQSSDRKISIVDVMNLQRNRFEHLPEFKPSDKAPSVTYNARGRYAITDLKDRAVYKYPLGNEYVLEGHIYQLSDKLPQNTNSVLWLATGLTRSAPYLPYYGNITDTYSAYKNSQSTKYDENSWYWVAANIDKMAFDYPDLFGNSVLEKWQAMEKTFIEEQAELNKLPEVSAEKATETSMARAEKVFKEMKALEAEMTEKITEKTGKAPIKAGE